MLGQSAAGVVRGDPARHESERTTAQWSSSLRRRMQPMDHRDIREHLEEEVPTEVVWPKPSGPAFGSP